MTTTATAPIVTIALTCNTITREIHSPDELSTIWEQKPTHCDAIRTGAPLTAHEQQAVSTAGYDSPTSIKTLYELCATIDETDVYLQPDYSPSPEQTKEILGMLVLCPAYPLAERLQQAVQRGQSDVAAEANGELFSSGTFRVGEQIKPGTYAIEGDIKDCYWERTDRTGKTIDNNFIAGAKRVQVTIRASDYSFTSERCGTWRRVR